MPTIEAPSALTRLQAITPSVSQVPAGGTTGGYQLIVVDKTGTRYALGELTNAEGESYSELLNEPGAASFSIPTLDPHAAAIVALERELQIWRNGRIQWWGPIVRPEADPKRLHVQCRSLEWHFFRRYFGTADRTNLLVNPSFETGDLTGWTTTNTTPVVTSSLFIEGQYSVRLEQSTALQDAHLSQIVDNFAATGVGTNIVLAGYYYIDAAAWIGEAIGLRGAAIRRLDATTQVPIEGGTVVWDIDGDAASGAKGTWIRFEIGLNVPPDAIEDIQVLLYSPGGLIYWDALTLTIPESVSSATSPTDFTDDLANLFAEIVAHAQDGTFDKSHLDIGVDAPLTGIRVERHYQLDEHANIGESLRQFSEEGLAEWWIAITPTTRTATLRSPTRGTRRPEFRVYLDGSTALGFTRTNIASTFRYSFDGEQAASSVVVLGPGDGSDREEGGAIDTALFGGVTYEEIIAAPAEANINSLDNLADEALSALSRPEVLRVTYLPRQRPGDADYLVSRDPIDSLHVGDTVPVYIDYGWIQIADEDFRVVAKEVDMQRDLATFVLNRVPVA